MKNIHKGAIAEHKVIARALEKGFVVSKPVIDMRYDVLIDNGETIDRVQIKYADGASSHSKGAVHVELRCNECSIQKGRIGKLGTYSRNDIDYILVYVPKVDKIVKLLDKHIGKKAVVLRYEEPIMGKRELMNFVNDLVW